MGSDLAPLARLLRLAPAFALLAAASPGVVFAEGSAWMAIAALALWGLSASRPGRFAFWIEALLGALAWSWICQWAAYVWWGTLFWIGPGYGLYMALAGVLLKRLAARWPLALAVPAAWMAAESLCSLLPPPLGMSWMRLGTHLAHVQALLGSARTWGFVGLGWVLAAAAGGAAGLVRARRLVVPEVALALAPTLVAVLLGALIGPGEFRPGPKVLLVQPGIPQERKMARDSARELFQISYDLTARGLAAAREQGLGDPDLVCWGESMLPIWLVAPGLEDEVRAGARLAPWYPFEIKPQDVLRMRRDVEAYVDDTLLGRRHGGLLPPGTSFLSGAEYLRAREGLVRRSNSVLVWDAVHGLQAPVDKLVRVPGAETMLGLERIDVVRDVIFELAGYIPDLFSDDDAPRSLRFDTRDGRTFRVGASVCYDNAFDAPFVRPLREGPLDFHLVASNEAWFVRSLEFDQMLAFTRVEAAATGRAVVRATNSGITCLVDGEGRVVERLVAEGRDRDTSGWLQVTVPVPSDPARRTPFVVTRPLGELLCLLAPLLLLGLRRRGNRPAEAG